MAALGWTRRALRHFERTHLRGEGLRIPRAPCALLHDPDRNGVVPQLGAPVAGGLARRPLPPHARRPRTIARVRESLPDSRHLRRIRRRLSRPSRPDVEARHLPLLDARVFSGRLSAGRDRSVPNAGTRSDFGGSSGRVGLLGARNPVESAPGDVVAEASEELARFESAIDLVDAIAKKIFRVVGPSLELEE